MLVMLNVTNPEEGMHAMTKREVKSERMDVKALLAEDADYLREMVRSIVEATLEAEMTAVVEP